ncbi:hypothetical protein SGFS_065870 [Streptomyces graminofaciens]|uniref:Uncharacterized protein n=2 Tax=Streptomyces graminofaciens TaxID=68212 RepID=A0ABN5VS01_9ACTN|nr:hypothetical protein SGFS_065870 [Streptomyces graminofaciens]
MPGAIDGKFTVKSCGKAHAWCAECRPAQAAAQRKPKPPRKEHDKPCRNCGRCDTCLGLAAPEGMKVCRDCRETKSLKAFARRNDTGGYRNQCMQCRNKGMSAAGCEGCGKSFVRHSADRTHCAACRPTVTKPCARCGKHFIGSMEQRRYCSSECREATLTEQRREAHRKVRLAALQAYGGEAPACVCCGEAMFQFLALDHINGGGHAQRKETGGGGFYNWLRRHSYPAGFQVLCHNCNFGRQINGGTCPHKEE